MNEKKEKELSVGQLAAEEISKAFGFPVIDDAEQMGQLASIIDKIIEQRSANATTPLTRELPPIETGFTTKQAALIEQATATIGALLLENYPAYPRKQDVKDVILDLVLRLSEK